MVFFFHLNEFHLVQLLDQGLGERCFRRLVAELFDEFFCAPDLFFLILFRGDLQCPLFGPLGDKTRIGHGEVIGLAIRELDGPVGDLIQECPVVADQYDTSRILLEELLQPYDGFDVQVIGWFIEQQKVVLTNQQFGQFHAHAPSS